MKNFICIIFICIWTNISFGQNIARVENVKIHSKYLNQEREIIVYTPIDYDYRKNEYFNVIYVFDSQNREFFDYTTSIISFLTDNTTSFIVVGITSPYNEDLEYARNNDLLPVLKTKASIKRYGEYSGNADNFLKYVSSEVTPYIDSNYRTLNNKIAIGHSLSASFILYSFIKNNNLFNSYIAISPNLAYENNMLANELINYDYTEINKLTALYLSNANEGVDYWVEWKKPREKVYSFFKKTTNNQNLKVQIHKFPDNNHWNTFPPSLSKAFEFYFKNIADLQEKELSKNAYNVTIKVKVPNKKDTIYITGNQENLGDWNPKKIKLKKISEFEREITLKLKSPAQFKFTRGNWDTEAETEGTYGNITIKPQETFEYNFIIENYIDKY